MYFAVTAHSTEGCGQMVCRSRSQRLSVGVILQRFGLDSLSSLNRNVSCKSFETLSPLTHSGVFIKVGLKLIWNIYVNDPSVDTDSLKQGLKQTTCFVFFTFGACCIMCQGSQRVARSCFSDYNLYVEVISVVSCTPQAWYILFCYRGES